MRINSLSLRYSLIELKDDRIQSHLVATLKRKVKIHKKHKEISISLTSGLYAVGSLPAQFFCIQTVKAFVLSFIDQIIGHFLPGSTGIHYNSKFIEIKFHLRAKENSSQQLSTQESTRPALIFRKINLLVFQRKYMRRTDLKRDSIGR